MFRKITYGIESNKKNYEITILGIIKESRIVADISYTNIIEAQLVITSDKSYISYTRNNSKTNYYLSILFSFLRDQSYSVPSYFDTYIQYNIRYVTERKIQNRIIFKSEKNTFIATIQDRRYGYYVRIGGKTFDGCLEIFINNEETKIAQIYSEPECGFDLDLAKDGTVDMIKSALQLCQVLFGSNQFKLDDDSNIECGKKNYSHKPPRKPIKPLSLLYLTLAKECKTWYELHFNAYIENETERNRYYESIMKLNDKINIEYNTFVKMAYIDDGIYDELHQYFNSSDTWLEFIKRIPKDKHCKLLKWVPSYFEKLMKFNPAHYKWIIRLDSAFKTSPIQNTDKDKSKETKEKNSNQCLREIITDSDNDNMPVMIRTDMIILTNRNEILSGGFLQNKIRKGTYKNVNIKNTTVKNKYKYIFSNKKYSQMISI